MTETAARAQRLFDAERWGDAAPLLHEIVAGNTGDDAGNRQLAQYHLAIALYRLELYQASFAIFRAVAGDRHHLKRRDTLRWLAKLATHLPEPAGVIDAVGAYRR